MTKILYLVPGIMEKREQSRREKIANTWASNGVSVEVKAVDEGPISIESSVEEDIAAGSVLRTIIRLQKGYDAIVLGCAGDPGLRAAKELAKIPVIGPAESTIAFSFLIGDRFGMVVPLDRDVPTMRALTVKYGFHNKLASVQAVNVPVLELGKDVELIKKKVTEACNDAIEEGADVIVLGCMSLAFILADELVKDSVKAPVLNPAKVSIKVAEVLAQLKLMQSRTSYPLADYGKLAKSVFKEELKNGF
ncbi:MAG: AroM family protein [Nitrososphaeria archaeon]